MKRILIFFIGIYQKVLSGLFPSQCRFLPTCSQYAKEAIEIKGWWQGSWKTLFRLLRCHRWSDGGFDPVR